MPKIKIQKLHPDAKIPRYQSPGASGFDLCALQSLEIAPQSIALVRTGLAIELEAGLEVQVRSRSGLALKHQIMVLNSPGTIDSDYRGELQVILMNLGNAPFSIKTGDRIAQAVLSSVCRAEFEEVGALGASLRGARGFGSSGIQ
ncbi:deoxyuridine 5'-triphosphate nucleotidohydrolase [Helicobacter bizzozeronii CIII-1]|uniref:Deoxyuridine 5'-triphosphate nucleotidohydrolase n=1 Tax=Helicobacter bizzozeronii (strain CIII-1) TaxID=1002804 RepID=F8KPV4_HELBC|nr:dUTP diphosphatase [Helicobacter bizzozeronii]CCB80848.1 deoxyuridine 5'-triphosphate nucleotidohydrolase [Helicobacter bizzozeronii CIII-1]